MSETFKCIARRGRLLQLLGVSLGALVISVAAQDSVNADGAQRLFEWRPFLAPFHGVVLHFPIGFLTSAFILEVYRMRRPSEVLRSATALIIWLSLVTGIISAVFGLMRAGTGGYDLDAVILHRNFGIAVPTLTLATIAFQNVAFRNEAIRAWTYAYRGTFACTLALLVVAGHLGGNLTHGSKYLVENAPEFLRKFIEGDREQPRQSEAGALDKNLRFYEEKVRPVFAEKCYSCHGPEKQKSGFRLDIPEIALKGGKSGETAIKPGDPIGSYLLELILLPPDDDDVMPPEGKQPLTMEEIMAILEWIRNGAVFPQALSSTETVVQEK